MIIYEVLTRYANALDDLEKYFGTLYSEPELRLHVYWKICGESVCWDLEDIDFNTKDATYSDEIIGNCVNRKKEYTHVYVNDGCGNKFGIILDNMKERN